MDSGKDITESFAHALVGKLGPNMKELWLFGSRARGDAREDSDYDFLVVISGDIKTVKGLVQDEEWQLMQETGQLVSSIIYTEEVWAQAKNSPLGWNILSEGKRVA